MRALILKTIFFVIAIVFYQLAHSMECHEIFNETSSDLAQLESALALPEAQSTRLPFHKKEIQNLVDTLARQIPVDVKTRIEMIQKHISMPLSADLDYSKPNYIFAYTLLEKMAIQGYLTDRDAGTGTHTLTAALKRIQSKGITGVYKNREKPLSQAKVDEIKLLLTDPVFKIIPLQLGHYKVQRLIKIISEEMPADPNERVARIYNTYGEYEAVRFNMHGSNEVFTATLLEILNINGGPEGGLTEADTAGNLHLINLIK